MSYIVWIPTIGLAIKHLHMLLQNHYTITRIIKGIAMGREILPRWALLLPATFSETGHQYHKDYVSLEQVRFEWDS